MKLVSRYKIAVWEQWLGWLGTERVRSVYRACTEHVQSMYGASTEHVQSKYGVGMMQVLITIIQYHEIL